MTEPLALLLVSSGTTDKTARSGYQEIEREISIHYPSSLILWSYTSAIIRSKLEKQGTKISSIEDNISELVSKGIRSLRIQPLYIAAGEEFSRMERAIMRALAQNQGCFDHAYLGRPLLESKRDRNEAAVALLTQFPKERTKEEAILFMAHGQHEGRGDLPLAALADELHRQDSLTFIATLEGEKTFDHILHHLRQKLVKTVWLSPLLLVAGYHVKNNMVGDNKNSWSTLLKQEGFTVKTNLQGIGENPEIRAIFSRHTIETTDDLASN